MLVEGKLIDRLRLEGPISLKEARNIPLFLERPTYRQILRWHTDGFRGVFLECFRQGKYIFTSEPAIRRFLQATQ